MRCDRVEIFYNGRVTRTLTGADINEHNIVSSSLNISAAGADPSEPETRLTDE